MSGIRQHTIPKFLLKGFASRSSGDRVYTWVYRKKKEPFETVLENVSVERHFYGKDSGPSADDIITDAEGALATLVKRLRNAEGHVDEADIPSLVVHMWSRTRHLRQNVLESSEFLFAELQAHLMDSENLLAFLFAHPDAMESAVTELLENVPRVPRFKMAQARDLARRTIRTYLRENVGEAHRLAQTMLTDVCRIIPQAIREGHINALIKAPDSSSVRFDWYSRLTWAVHSVDSPLILPDCVCFFECDSGRFKTLDDETDKAKTIYMPISSRKLLIGTALCNQAVDVHFFNEIAAKCSHELFVSAACSDETALLASQIGVLSDLLTKNEREEILSEILQK